MEGQPICKDIRPHRFSRPQPESHHRSSLLDANDWFQSNNMNKMLIAWQWPVPLSYSQKLKLSLRHSSTNTSEIFINILRLSHFWGAYCSHLVWCKLVWPQYRAGVECSFVDWNKHLLWLRGCGWRLYSPTLRRSTMRYLDFARLWHTLGRSRSPGRKHWRQSSRYVHSPLLLQMSFFPQFRMPEYIIESVLKQASRLAASEYRQKIRDLRQMVRQPARVMVARCESWLRVAWVTACPLQLGPRR